MNETISVFDNFAKSYGLAFAVLCISLVVVWREWRRNEAERWQVLRELTDLVKQALK